MRPFEHQRTDPTTTARWAGVEPDVASRATPRMADLSPLSDRVVLDEAHLQAEEILAAARRQAAEIRRVAESELERTRLQIAEMRLAASRELAEAQLRAAVLDDHPEPQGSAPQERDRASKYTRRSAGLPRLGTQAGTVHAAMQQLRRSSPPVD